MSGTVPVLKRGPITVGRKPDFAKPTSRPGSMVVMTLARAAPKRSGGGSRRAEPVVFSIAFARRI
jgi:hypothetical protein